MGSGSDSNDEDLVAGRTNRMERRTILWADAAPGEPDFNGPAILIVEVAKDLEDSEWDNSDYDDYWAYIPANQVHGIMATAWSGGSIADDPDDLAGDPGGIGVIGRGGRNEGTGVQGLGGGINGPSQLAELVALVSTGSAAQTTTPPLQTRF